MDNVTVQVIPSWYLGLSAFLLVVISIMFIALCGLVYVLIKTVRNLQLPMTSLITKVNDDLVPKVESLVVKVDGLTEKVSGIADNAKALSSSARGTVETVSGGASAVTHALASFTESGLSKLKGIAPVLGIAFTALKLVKEFREARGTPAKKDS